MKREKLVVIGGVAAGMSAASKAKRENPALDVHVYERGPHVAYAQCGLPYYLAGYVSDPEKLVVRNPAQFKERGIRVYLFHEAVELDAQKKTVTIRNLLEAKVESVAYDYLVIATGADPVMPNLPGMQLPGVLPIKTIPDAEAIQRTLEEHQANHIVLMGGGYINVEMAEALVTRGKKPLLFQRPSQVLKSMDESFGRMAGEELEKHGVTVRAGEEVQSLKGENKVQEVITDQGRYPADLVIVALGIRPNTQWLAGSGLAMAEQGGIQVDGHGGTNLENVYAAGECALVYHRIKKRFVYHPLGTSANKQGKTAGAAIAGKPIVFGGILGTSVVKVMDLAFGKTGLSEKEAIAEKIEYQTSTVTGSSHASSYPGASPVTIKLVVEKTSRKLLGAQIMGPVEGSKRLDVLALAIQNEMTVEELGMADLSYAPPFATVWDVVQVAANAVKRGGE